MPVPYLAASGLKVSAAKAASVKKRGGTNRFDTIRTWLTKPDSLMQAFAGDRKPNRPKMLLWSGFLATFRVVPQFVTGTTRPGRLTRSTWPSRIARSRPMDDDPMINDPGKHRVNEGQLTVSLRAGLRHFHADFTGRIA